MARYCGKIGFAVQKNTDPGVWVDDITERTYYGDVIHNSRRLQTSGNLNDDVEISNRLSIIGNPYAYENFHNMRYAVYMGSKWKVTEVEVQYPRLILSLGGLYNG